MAPLHQSVSSGQAPSSPLASPPASFSSSSPLATTHPRSPSPLSSASTSSSASSKMSLSQTYLLAHHARARLAAEAGRADHRLLRLVGHANLLDSVMDELAAAEQEQELWFNQATSSTPAPSASAPASTMASAPVPVPSRTPAPAPATLTPTPASPPASTSTSSPSPPQPTFADAKHGGLHITWAPALVTRSDSDADSDSDSSDEDDFYDEDDLPSPLPRLEQPPAIDDLDDHYLDDDEDISALSLTRTPSRSDPSLPTLSPRSTSTSTSPAASPASSTAASEPLSPLASPLTSPLSSPPGLDDSHDLSDDEVEDDEADGQEDDEIDLADHPVFAKAFSGPLFASSLKLPPLPSGHWRGAPIVV